MTKRETASDIRFPLSLLAVTAMFLLLGGSGWADEEPAFGGEFRVPIASEPQKLDPAYSTSIYTCNVIQNLFDGLVEFDENLNVVPAIARRWIISRDHRTYTFYLRKGVRFHNGREVTAEDFVYSLTRILDPATKSPVASFFAHILGAGEIASGRSKTVRGLSATDSHTLTIELKEPFAPFISILAMVNGKVVPKEAMGPDFGTNPVGTGPFKMHRWEPGRAVILTANKEYFAGRPQIDSLRFVIYPNIQWEVIFKDFENGLLEQAFIPRGKYEEIALKPEYKRNFQFVSTPGLNVVYVGMNQTIPPFDDLKVRKAISHGVDTRTLTRKITRRGAVPAKGILPPGIAGFDPNFKGYTYDPAKAKKLLAEAGYPGGEGMPPVEIWTVSKSPGVHRQLESLGGYLGELGIELVPKVAGNWKEFISVINNKKAPMYYAAWYADYPDPDNFLHVLFHSDSPINRMAYHNEKADRMLEDARHETDYLKRVKMYWEIERMVMNDAPLLCLHNNTSNNMVQRWVKGLSIGYLGQHYVKYRNVWIDKR